MFLNWFKKESEQTKKELLDKREETFYQKIKRVEGINKEKNNNKDLTQLISSIKSGLITESENGGHYYSKYINNMTYQPFYLKSLFRSLNLKNLDEHQVVDAISKAIGPEFNVTMTYVSRIGEYEIVITWN